MHGWIINQGSFTLTCTHPHNQLTSHSQGRESLSRYLQSLNSELFGADIHPACTIGRVRLFVCARWGGWVDRLMIARPVTHNITTINPE